MTHFTHQFVVMIRNQPRGNPLSFSGISTTITSTKFHMEPQSGHFGSSMHVSLKFGSPRLWHSQESPPLPPAIAENQPMFDMYLRRGALRCGDVEIMKKQNQAGNNDQMTRIKIQFNPIWIPSGSNTWQLAKKEKPINDYTRGEVYS